MKNFMMVTIKSDPQLGENSIFISADLFNHADYSNNRVLHLRIGKTNHKVIVKTSKSSQESNTFYFNPALIKKSFLKDGHLYGVKLTKDAIHIGPVVGILAPRIGSRSRPYGGQTRFFQELMASARKLGEICFAFYFSDIDWKKRVINGSYHSNKGWQRMKFPIPDVIYPRGKFWLPSQAEYRRRLNNLGVAILNPPMVGKWDAYRFLKNNPELLPYLPETRLVNSFHQVEIMAKKYRSIYLKPVNGTKGKNIIRVSKNKNSPGYSYYYQSNGTLYKGNAPDFYYLKKRLRPLMAGRSYLVQREISLIRYDGGLVDIRVMAQKDNRGRWELTGMACRVGKRGAITSNISSGGSGKKVETVLRKAFSDNKQINQIMETVAFVSLTAAQTLEYNLGNCGEMGIDIGVDKLGQVWFIEANLRPARYVFSMIGEKETRLKSVETPLLYARYLAGFQG